MIKRLRLISGQTLTNDKATTTSAAKNIAGMRRTGRTHKKPNAAAAGKYFKPVAKPSEPSATHCGHRAGVRTAQPQPANRTNTTRSLLARSRARKKGGESSTAPNQMDSSIRRGRAVAHAVSAKPTIQVRPTRKLCARVSPSQRSASHQSEYT